MAVTCPHALGYHAARNFATRRTWIFPVRMAQNNSVQKPNELIQLVDESNRPAGTAKREEMRARNLTHRCSFTLTLNCKKRVACKVTYPSHYDPAPGGVVGAGESYEENATRELEEEMGIKGVQLQQHFDFLYEDTISRLWGRLFSCQYSGSIALDPEEVESGRFMSLMMWQSYSGVAQSALTAKPQ